MSGASRHKEIYKIVGISETYFNLIWENEKSNSFTTLKKTNNKVREYLWCNLNKQWQRLRK